jgi:betaine-aldehyde dehydrogenase
LIEMICLENGKLKAEATYEVAYTVRSLRFAAGLATQIFGRVLDPTPGKQSMCIRQPAGVAGLMIPWNSPGYLTIRALAPAMASGCASVVRRHDWAVPHGQEKRDDSETHGAGNRRQNVRRHVLRRPIV